LTRGRISRQTPGRFAIGDALLAAALFGGVVLVNGFLAMLLIELLQALGWWEVAAADGANGAAVLSGRLRARSMTTPPVPLADPAMRRC
jgi:hypothetical protein